MHNTWVCPIDHLLEKFFRVPKIPAIFFFNGGKIIMPFVFCHNSTVYNGHILIQWQKYKAEGLIIL